MKTIDKILEWISPRFLPLFFGIQTAVVSYRAGGVITNDVLFFTLIFCTSLIGYKLDQIKEKVDAKNNG